MCEWKWNKTFIVIFTGQMPKGQVPNRYLVQIFDEILPDFNKMVCAQDLKEIGPISKIIVFLSN